SRKAQQKAVTMSSQFFRPSLGLNMLQNTTPDNSTRQLSTGCYPVGLDGGWAPARFRPHRRSLRRASALSQPPTRLTVCLDAEGGWGGDPALVGVRAGRGRCCTRPLSDNPSVSLSITCSEKSKILGLEPGAQPPGAISAPKCAHTGAGMAPTG